MGAGPGGGQPGWFEHLRQMSPEEQERFLQNHPRFQQLRPQQQEEIRRRLHEWNSLTPQEREERLTRERRLADLSPDERRRIRTEVFPRWQQLAPRRKMGIVRRLNALHGLTEEERETRLNDAAFTQGLTPDEIEILRTFSRLRLGPGANPGQPTNPPPELPH
jgi:hypothetical protein